MARRTFCDTCTGEVADDGGFSDRPISGLTTVNTKTGQSEQKDFCRDCTTKIIDLLEKLYKTNTAKKEK